jgi:hypothetical protein
MAKGKHQASQTAKKLQEALERIADLERTLEEVTSESAAREEQLRVDVQRLRGRLTAEVDLLASDRVRRIEEEAHAKLQTARREARERVERGLRAIGDHIIGELTLRGVEGWDEVTSAFGVTVGDLMSWVGTPASRLDRRMKRGDMYQGSDMERADSKGYRAALVVQDGKPDVWLK